MWALLRAGGHRKQALSPHIVHTRGSPRILLWLIMPEPLRLPYAASLDAGVLSQTWSCAKPVLALRLESESHTKVQPCLTSAGLGCLGPSVLIQILLEFEMTIKSGSLWYSQLIPFISGHWLCVSRKPVHKMPGPADTQNKLCFVL